MNQERKSMNQGTRNLDAGPAGFGSQTRYGNRRWGRSGSRSLAAAGRRLGVSHAALLAAPLLLGAAVAVPGPAPQPPAPPAPAGGCAAGVPNVARLGAPVLDRLEVGSPLTSLQRSYLCSVAEDTWKFFLADADTPTGLPMDNIGFDGAPATGPYTNASDIAMYLWAIAAARQLGIVSPGHARSLAAAELAAIGRLVSSDGFLFDWYSTTTGQVITGPGGGPVSSLTGHALSTVNNGWYASALVVTREAFPSLYGQATALLDRMDFGLFYDSADGQLYGDYQVGVGPASYENGALDTDWRIANYMGLGLQQLPGRSWWDTWLTFPPSLGFTWQTQEPSGPTVSYVDPYSAKTYSVYEGHYTYDGIQYIPSWGGSEFEALMAPLVVPETSWGTNGFGQNDVNYAEASIAYATDALHYDVWGLSPASIPGTTGGYDTYGAYELGEGGSGNAYANTAVAPYASFLALPILPQQAYANITTIAHDYPGIVGPDGFFDSLDPTTGTVAPRYLALDQGMVLAGVDDALEGGGLQRYFAADPVGQRIRPYLAEENFDLVAYPGTRLSAGGPAPGGPPAGAPPAGGPAPGGPAPGGRHVVP